MVWKQKQVYDADGYLVRSHGGRPVLDTVWEWDRAEEDFLLAIVRQPDGDALRLAYADWLQKQEDNRDIARGRFLRVQVEVTQRSADPAARHRPLDNPRQGGERRPARSRLRSG